MPENSAFIDTLPPLRQVIADFGLRAEKKLGQNFLLDLNLTDKIARQAGDLAGGHVIEIGPGPGGLTRALLKTAAASVTAIEFDGRAVAALQPLVSAAAGRLHVMQADALECDLTALAPAPRHVVANLPYNIATPLLINWLRQMREDADAYVSLTLMFQEEVADRILASPGTKAYGRLSVMTQWLCDARKALRLPPSAFTPPPKINSAVVCFRPRLLGPDAPSFAAMEKTVAAAFSQRRKMIRTTLKGVVLDDVLEEMGPTRRAEELSVAEFSLLAVNPHHPQGSR